MLPSSVKILFTSQTEKAELWLPLLRRALPQDELVAAPDTSVEIALVATPPAGTFQKLGRPRLVQSLWMGVEKLLADPTYPRGVPLARLVDPGMVAAMSETVIAHVLDWHRHLYRYRLQQRARQWHRMEQRMACDRTVGLLGLGELGGDAARKLLALGFNVAGWSRRPKDLPGVRSFTDLTAMLARDATAEEVNGAFEQTAASSLAGVLHYSTDPLVSRDIIGEPASCVFDSGLTQAVGSLVKVFGWYDNEWGYTCRLADLTAIVGAQL